MDEWCPSVNSPANSSSFGLNCVAERNGKWKWEIDSKDRSVCSRVSILRGYSVVVVISCCSFVLLKWHYSDIGDRGTNDERWRWWWRWSIMVVVVVCEWRRRIFLSVSYRESNILTLTDWTPFVKPGEEGTELPKGMMLRNDGCCCSYTVQIEFHNLSGWMEADGDWGTCVTK